MEHPAKMATIHLKLPPVLRDRLSGTLRSHGVTMQGFLADVCHLIVNDDAFFQLVQAKRNELNPDT